MLFATNTTVSLYILYKYSLIILYIVKRWYFIYFNQYIVFLQFFMSNFEDYIIYSFLQVI